MNLRWSLKELYSSFECNDFKNDLKKLSEFIEKYKLWVTNNTKDKENIKIKIEEYVEMTNSFIDLFMKLFGYSQLTFSVNTKDEAALKNIEIIEEKYSLLAEPNSKLEKWIGSIGNLDEIINSSEMLKEHSFHLKEIQEKSKYLLSEKEEAIIAQMKNTGSNAWSKLQDQTISSLMVDIELDGEKKQLPLPQIRNIAYEADKDKRKLAYESELKAYEKIDNISAACLNGIKGEVITLSRKRGYESPLDNTLINSRMDRASLEAMLEAMKESLPAFRKYFKKKAELLGHKNGLPFYDLFAPVGDIDMQFTYEEAKDYIVKNFRTFSDKLADYALNAFNKNWIDSEIREGKVGGAFCENLHMIGESRIMANFSGSFSDVVTLAHELGHGYHGHCLTKESAINSDYPMPIAETASNFCEAIVKKSAVKLATEKEAFSILENEISDCAQVIVDIYSRYLFETELFKRREKSSVSPKELKEIMLDAQKASYGEGLDPEYLHPYMWVCKPHYYYAEANFYNFPYAFGLLFAKGLYAEYLNRGSKFVEEYDKLLSITGKNKIADITKVMNIDIHSIEFWRNSLKLVEDDINAFLKLSEKYL